MKWETIDKSQIDDLMAGKDPKPPVDTNDTTNKPETPKQDTTVTPDYKKPAGQV
jgi:cell division protease FtsH